MGSNSSMPCILIWLLCLESMLAIPGFSSEEAAGFKLTMTPEHFVSINGDEAPTFNVDCVLRDREGQRVPLAGCGYQDYYDKFTMQFNEGHASSDYTHYDEFKDTTTTGKYQGRGLEHGECGLTFGGYKNGLLYILGCRVRPLIGAWQTAAMMLCISENTTVRNHLEPPGVTLALEGSEVTIEVKAEHVLGNCMFYLPPVDYQVKLDFFHGLSSDNETQGRYHGAGLDKKECGAKLHNVQPERSGFLRSEIRIVTTDSSSYKNLSFDFIELIVATAPDDSGMTKTATREGGILNVTCWSKNSRPVANITWLLDDRVIRQDTTNEAPVETEWLWDHDPQSITQHLLLNVTREDNGKKLVCRVGHLALPSGVVDISQAVQVRFFHDHVTLKQITSKLTLGAQVTFACESGISNPPATHTWYRDRTRLNNSITSTKPGQHGGQITTSNLTLNLIVDMNGAVIRCIASNIELKKILYDTLSLKFTYAPVFESPPIEEQILAVGTPITLVVKAKGNPTDIDYTWTRFGADNITVAEGPVLNFTHLEVYDSGWYTCTAVNSVGSAAVKFKLTVVVVDFKTHFIIAVVICGLLVAALGVLVGFLWFYKQLCWSVNYRLFEQEMASSTTYENTTDR